MKTATIEVSGLLSALSASGVEKQLAKPQGVHKVEINYVAGSATVVYDETATGFKAIKAKVRECGYHCSGERLPPPLRKAPGIHWRRRFSSGPEVRQYRW